jgi:hypothetical protein
VAPDTYTVYWTVLYDTNEISFQIRTSAFGLVRHPLHPDCLTSCIVCGADTFGMIGFGFDAGIGMCGEHPAPLSAATSVNCAMRDFKLQARTA